MSRPAELDADSADAVYDLLGEAVREAGATLVLVTHDRRASRIADRVVRIRDGRLSEEWSPDEPHRETSVVDDRGWVRLPEPLRRWSGATEGVRAAAEGDRIVLQGLGSSTDAPAAMLLSAARLSRGEPRCRAVGAAQGRPGGVRPHEWSSTDTTSLDVRPATLTVVRGRSGSGKSTILRVLLGLADPDEGQVLLGGVDLSGLDRTARADLAARGGGRVRSGRGVGRAAGRRGEPRLGAYRAWSARRPRRRGRDDRRAGAAPRPWPCRTAPVRRRASTGCQWRGLSSSADHWWCSMNRPLSRTRRTPSVVADVLAVRRSQRSCAAVRDARPRAVRGGRLK